MAWNELIASGETKEIKWFRLIQLKSLILFIWVSCRSATFTQPHLPRPLGRPATPGLLSPCKDARRRPELIIRLVARLICGRQILSCVRVGIRYGLLRWPHILWFPVIFQSICLNGEMGRPGSCWSDTGIWCLELYLFDRNLTWPWPVPDA